jgi:hypothetical protein
LEGLHLFPDKTLPDELDPLHTEYQPVLQAVRYSDGSDFPGSEFYGNLQLVGPLIGAMLTASVNNATMMWAWKGFLDTQATSMSLMISALKLKALPADRVMALSLLFPPQSLVTLRDLAAYAPVLMAWVSEPSGSSADFAALSAAVEKLKEADKLADLLADCVLDWTAPSRWLPISYDEARKSITSLPDLQLVIDNILSSEWENRSPMTRWDNPQGGRKPDACLPDSPDIALVGPEQGIVPWIDPETGQPGDLWIVAEAAPAAETAHTVHAAAAADAAADAS